MNSIKELKRKLFKSRFLNGLLVGVICASLAYAAATKYTDLTVTGNMSVTGNTTLTGANTLTGNTTVAGTLDVTGNSTAAGTFDVTGVTSVSSATISQRLLLSTTANAISTFTATTIDLDDGLTLTVDGLFSLPSAADPNTSVTPGRAGQVMFDSSTGDVCVATAAAVNSWVIISSGTNKCAS